MKNSPSFPSIEKRPNEFLNPHCSIFPHYSTELNNDFKCLF